MSQMGSERPPVKATATSFQLLEAVHNRNGARVTELAKETGLAKSAVYKHLMTLTQLGYLVKEDTTYYLSVTLERFGVRARERYPIHVAAPAIDNLAGTTRKIVNFVIAENSTGVYAYQTRTNGTEDPPAPVYSRVPLHATAGGKAILAYLPTAERERILEARRLAAVTEKTITNADALRDELQSVHDRRVAYEREEFKPGYQCVASPVLVGNSHPVGAVSVSGMTAEMTGKRLEEDVAGLVVSTAKSIESDIQ